MLLYKNPSIRFKSISSIETFSVSANSTHTFSLHSLTDHETIVIIYKYTLSAATVRKSSLMVSWSDMKFNTTAWEIKSSCEISAEKDCYIESDALQTGLIAMSQESIAETEEASCFSELDNSVIRITFYKTYVVLFWIISSKMCGKKIDM